ncbi:MAG: adenylosuccinate synthase [Candidatus Promineifilaceae bacterium]|nr:adenylosuccinate synthase [Candidatus Promineifilaceae bacterium]
MPVTVVIGAQWGDEGKGRIVDYLAQDAHLVVRPQGGDNAGHTVVNARGTFKLHLIPSGIFRPECTCLLGTGMVINPVQLLTEIDELERSGLDMSRLFISSRASIIMPYHLVLDRLSDAARGDVSIGTTSRGIGPAYADKAARRAPRMGDLLHPDYLRTHLEAALPHVNNSLAHLGEKPVELDEILAQCERWAEALGPRIVDSIPLVQAAITDGKNVLLEGQGGMMRDLDWGIYPYVTSSNPVAAGAVTGAGIPPTHQSDVLGVVKVYSTCVGAGPFPVELKDDVGRHLREVGQEYGATTGRPRRCGWLDAVVLAQAAWLNGFTGMAVTKLDVLDALPEIQICVGYRSGDQVLKTLPHNEVLEKVTPVYERWPGWQTETGDARTWDELPANAQAYLRRIEELAGAPIHYISVGPEREAMITLPIGRQRPPA